jgi:cytochrome c peroxidase
MEELMRNIRFLVAGTLAAFTVSSAMGADDAALLREVQQIFRPLPKDMGTADFPVTKERVRLGQLLFFDPRMTLDGNVSCATCHQPGLYGTDGLPTSIGVRQRPHPRNAPTILNAATQVVIHWRGDRQSLEDQVEQALTSPISSGQPDERAVIERLRRILGYAALFKAAFPTDADPLTVKNIAKAIGSYERTLVTPSPFDAYLTGDVNALSAAARAGLETFIRSGCATCHNSAGVGGRMYRKFGVVEDYWIATGSQAIDKGRADVTQNAADLYVFRVASLRNVAMTAPYFHDGSVATLPEAVRVMARVQLGAKLKDNEVDDIIAFLNSLTGDLPADFAIAPILPAGAVTIPKP